MIKTSMHPLCFLLCCPHMCRRQSAHLWCGAGVAGPGRAAGRCQVRCAAEAAVALASLPAQRIPKCVYASPCSCATAPSCPIPTALLNIPGNNTHRAPPGARLGWQRRRSVFVPLGECDEGGGALPQTLVVVHRWGCALLRLHCAVACKGWTPAWRVPAGLPLACLRHALTSAPWLLQGVPPPRVLNLRRRQHPHADAAPA